MRLYSAGCVDGNDAYRKVTRLRDNRGPSKASRRSLFDILVQRPHAFQSLPVAATAGNGLSFWREGNMKRFEE